jgi:hypothetical protein
MPDITIVQTALTLVEGLAYEPWIKTVVLFSVVSVVLACCWRAVARYVMHADSKALAGLLLARLTRVGRQLQHASRYAPEMERYRRRWGPYLALVSLGDLVACYGFCALLALFFMYVSMDPRHVMASMLLFFLSVILGRYHLAAAGRAWHSIKTGKAFN